MVTSRIGLSDSNQCGSPTFLSWILCETPEQILVHYRILSPGFTDKAKVWNRDVFGNLFHRKKCTLARLRGAQIALSNNPNNFLSWLEQELRTELAKVSKLEEEFWAMKSHITWLVEGDRNIGFYHTSALVHRSKNRINCLKDNMGNWLTEESDIADYIRTGFASLFMTSHNSLLLSLWNPSC